jgi:hypothetical protein
MLLMFYFSCEVLHLLLLASLLNVAGFSTAAAVISDGLLVSMLLLASLHAVAGFTTFEMKSCFCWRPFTVLLVFLLLWAVMSTLLLLVADATTAACVTAIACIPAPAGIPAIAGVPLVTDVLTVAALYCT